MKKEILGLNFDGTVTPAEHHIEYGTDMEECYINGLIDSILVLGEFRKNREEIEEYIKRVYGETRRRVLANPDKHPKFWQDEVTCYPDEDPMAVGAVTTRTLLNEDVDLRQFILMAHGSYGAFADGCYKKLNGKEKAIPIKRNELKELKQKFEIKVITNSSGGRVQRALPDIKCIRAQKFVIDPNFEELRGRFVFERRIFNPRRPSIYEEMKKAGINLYIGNCLTLDGLVPSEMNIPFYLIRTAYTPESSVKYVEQHPNCQMIDSLTDIL